VNGCAVITDSVGHLDCRVVATYEGGDHTIYVGEVDDGDAAELPPLLFFCGGYRRLEG
jgi:flavin reductase (DIM6/NTAB) family NADH-FMN oxidoreductase RutF